MQPTEFIDQDSGQIVQLGMVPDLTNQQYHEAPGDSSSTIKAVGEKSLLHFWYGNVRPDREPEPESEDLIFGTAIHTSVLEPHLFEGAYLKSMKWDRRTKDGKAGYADFLEQCKEKGAIGLHPDQYEACLRIRDRIHAHPIARGFLTGGAAEQSFFSIDPETGGLKKCRPDYLAGACIDLKSTTDASEESFGRDIGNMGYDVSAAWYIDVLTECYGYPPEHFVWLAAEKTPPYAIGIHFATPEQIAAGRAYARRHYLRLLNARKTNRWPDYGEEFGAIPANIPRYIRR